MMLGPALVFWHDEFSNSCFDFVKLKTTLIRYEIYNLI